MTKPPRVMSLRTRLILGATLFILAPAAVAAVLSYNSLRREAETMLLDQMVDQAENARDLLTSRLDRLWTQVRGLSSQVHRLTPEELRQRLTLIRDIDNRFSWIGYVGLDGQVIAASNGVLEGENLSAWPWFVEGLRGPYAANDRESETLKKLPHRSEPARFTVFAAPVKDAAGKTVGVLGAHFEWQWLRDTMYTFQGTDAKALLLSQDRHVLFSPPDPFGRNWIEESSTLPAFAASSGRRYARTERWANGRSYLTAIQPIGSTAGAPSLGWSIVMLRDAEAVTPYLQRIASPLLMSFGLAALVSLALVTLLAAANSGPIARLSQFARLLAEEKDAGVPPSPSGSREAMTLALALTHIQSQLRAKPAPAQKPQLVAESGAKLLQQAV